VEEHFEMTMISLLAGMAPEPFEASSDFSICVISDLGPVEKNQQFYF
jgi:hypothetical protein